jgi:hypothetical protein
MFNLVKESVRLVNVNPRNEKHGDEDVLACDLSLEAKLHNAVLLKFSPTLRDALYTTDPGATADMINPDHAPKLRNPQMGKINWALDLKNVRFSVFADGTNDEEIIFTDTKCKKFTLICQEGGTVVVGFQIQVSAPDEEHVTKLLFLLNKMLKVSLDVGDQDESDEGDDDSAGGNPDAPDDLLSHAQSDDDGSDDNNDDGTGDEHLAGGAEGDHDELYERATAFVRGRSGVSITVLKREFKCSQLVAARMLVNMQAEGIVGEAAGNGVREVFALPAATA